MVDPIKFLAGFVPIILTAPNLFTSMGHTLTPLLFDMAFLKAQYLDLSFFVSISYISNFSLAIVDFFISTLMMPIITSAALPLHLVTRYLLV